VAIETAAGIDGRSASLRRRVLTIAAFAGVCVTGLIGYSGRVVLDVKEILDEQRTVLSPAMRAADAYEIAVREQQRGERGYVITSDRTYLLPYEEGGPEAARALADLRRLAAGDSLLLTQIDEAAAAHRKWFDEAARPSVAAVDRGEPDQAAATVAKLGRVRFESFIAEMSDVEHDATGVADEPGHADAGEGGDRQDATAQRRGPPVDPRRRLDCHAPIVTGQPG
jgi:sigma-B regulation protein RsbU (phosphoserine phosphatase)